MTAVTVAELAEFVDGRCVGDGSVRIEDVADLRQAGPTDIGFVRDLRFAALVGQSRAGAVIVESALDVRMPQIVVARPDVAFARIGLRFHPVPTATEHDLHPTADVASDAQLEMPVALGPHVSVGRSAKIGRGTLCGAGVVIGEGARIGRDCTLFPRAVVYPGTVIGDRVILHAGAVVGSDGFGYARDGERWVKIPQIGHVVIEDDVEIGANATIDRATLGITRIGRGSKIDNLVHVGHNCTIGEDCAMAGFSALAGSTHIGDRVSMGGHVVSAGHLKVANDARIGGNSVLYGDVREPGEYLGYPLQPKSRWARTLHVLGRLPELLAEVRQLRQSRGSNSRDDHPAADV
jgi:UDP-3-O-[3-hydroxymyristoyl] glucosamine N-acyltransferase